MSARTERSADQSEQIDTPDGPGLVITRTFDAPRELVWKAWTDAEHAAMWMGPHGFTATHMTQDARVGGKWRLCLHRNSDGIDMWQGGVFREIVPPARVVYTFSWDADHGKKPMDSLITITFDDVGGKTRMVFRQLPFDSKENRDGHIGGWSETFDRFAEFVASGMTATTM